jgi:uncharacterized membrane protein YbhN (UPF0104 family)
MTIGRQLRAKGRVLAVLALAGLAAAVLLSGRAGALVDAFGRAAHADWRLVALAVALEVLSFASYVALFHAVFRRSGARIDLRASYEITVAGTAMARLAPTAGAGGVALTAWALRRAGLSRRGVGEHLLAFLVLLYAVYLVGLVAAGSLVITGVVGQQDSVAPAVAAVVLGSLAILGALLAGPAGARLGDQRAIGRGALLVGSGMRRALAVARTRDPALAGALGWWAFDIGVLWLMFSAVGAAPPLIVLTLGYFLGTLANTVPVPGALSGGLIGVQVALGAPLAVAVAAVLSYRAIALWLPALVGTHALPRLRGTVAGWTVGPAEQRTRVPSLR